MSNATETNPAKPVISAGVLEQAKKAVAPPEASRQMTQPPTAGAATTPPTTAPAPEAKKDNGKKIQDYSKEDALDVSKAVIAGTKSPDQSIYPGARGFTVDQAALDEMLDTTMVQKKRPKQVGGDMGKLWAGMEPMFQQIMNMLMEMMGQGSAEARDTSAAMSRVLCDIQGSGPGEGVFKEYKSNHGFGKDELIASSIVNGNLAKAQQAGDKEAIERFSKQKEALNQANIAKFGLSSDQMWQVFEQDKRIVMEETVVAMAKEARENGLVDTSIDRNRLMASFHSKAAAERAAVDNEKIMTMRAIKDGIIVPNDPNKPLDITDEQKKTIELHYKQRIFGSSNTFETAATIGGMQNGDMPVGNPLDATQAERDAAVKKREQALGSPIFAPQREQSAREDALRQQQETNKAAPAPVLNVAPSAPTPPIIVPQDNTQRKMTQANDNNNPLAKFVAPGQFNNIISGGCFGGDVNVPTPTLGDIPLGGINGIGGMISPKDLGQIGTLPSPVTKLNGIINGCYNGR